MTWDKKRARVQPGRSTGLRPPGFTRTVVPIIEKVFSIVEVVDAHRMMEEDKHFGKIVLKIQ